MKVAIVGSRNFNDPYVRVRKNIRKQAALFGDRIIIVTGGGGKVDHLAYTIAVELGLRCIVIPAQWEKYGKKAGPIRNAEIVKTCDKVIAFWDGKSRGTADVINKAKFAGKKVIIRKDDEDQRPYKKRRKGT